MSQSGTFRMQTALLPGGESRLVPLKVSNSTNSQQLATETMGRANEFPQNSAVATATDMDGPAPITNTSHTAGVTNTTATSHTAGVTSTTATSHTAITNRTATTQVTRSEPVMTRQPSTIASFGVKLPSWKPGSFCDEFIDHTLHQPVSVCGPKVTQDKASVVCLKNPKSTRMATCLVRNLGVDPRTLYHAMLKPATLEDSNSIWLTDNQCPNLTLTELKQTAEKGDYVNSFTEGLKRTERSGHPMCEKWINKTAFFYIGDAIHVYFKTLAWYNLHKSLLNNNVTAGNFIVVRLNDPDSYLFEDLERALFPGFMKLNEFPNVTTCFRKVVLAPRSFSSVGFRCKMEANVKSSCFNCNGRGLYGSTLLTFRESVLKACSFSDLTPEQWKNKKTRNIVVLLRKFYQRWETDTPQKFQRVLSNSDELLKGLRESFPSTNVTAVHMEDLPICEQIRYAHDADVLMGVHGAGLVHLWWIQEEALILELEPMNQVGNPSFRMLSTLAGRRYQRVTASSGQQKVSVNVGDVVKKLKSVTDLN